MKKVAGSDFDGRSFLAGRERGLKAFQRFLGIVRVGIGLEGALKRVDGLIALVGQQIKVSQIQ
jgi:hypothetical protein